MAVITSPASVGSRPRFVTSPPYRVGILSINPRTREVRVAGDAVHLSRKEYELLCVLAGDPTRVFTREELHRSVWGITCALRTRTLDSHAHRLRTKLSGHGDSFVHNVWGVGYRLTDVAAHVDSPPVREVEPESHKYLVTDTSEYLVEASCEEEARQVYLARGGTFVGLTDLIIEVSD